LEKTILILITNYTRKYKYIRWIFVFFFLFILHFTNFQHRLIHFRVIIITIFNCWTFDYFFYFYNIQEFIINFLWLYVNFEQRNKKIIINEINMGLNPLLLRSFSSSSSSLFSFVLFSLVGHYWDDLFYKEYNLYTTQNI